VAVAVARVLALAALGVVLGLFSVFVHQRLPGLVLGLLATAAVTWALPGGWTWRFPFAAGWVAFLGYALLPRAGGGYLVASDVRGYVLLGFGLLVLVIGIVTVRPLRPPPSPPAAPPPVS
jgi:hypothetical protein